MVSVDVPFAQQSMDYSARWIGRSTTTNQKYYHRKGNINKCRDQPYGRVVDGNDQGQSQDERGHNWRNRRHPRIRQHNGDTPICKFYQQGRCNAGDSCRFLHVNKLETTKCFRTNPGSVYPYTVPQPDQDFGNASFLNNQSPSVLVKNIQDQEERPYHNIKGPFYSIDVECVATGTGHSSSRHRAPGRVAMVDPDGHVVINEIVAIDERKVVSYLTPLTGLTQESCSRQSNLSLDEVVASIRAKLPSDAVLVGQSIQKDIEWLGLREGIDFREYIDIGIIFRQRIPSCKRYLNFRENTNKCMKYDCTNKPIQSDPSFREKIEPLQKNNESAMVSKMSGYTLSQLNDPHSKYIVFSLRHTCLNLMGVDIQTSYHDPALDAKYSLELFGKYHNMDVRGLRAARDSLHRAPSTPGVASTYRVIEGVCLSKQSYRYKNAARSIWKWWRKVS